MPRMNRPSVEYLRQCFTEKDGRLYWKRRPLGHFVDKRTWKIWNTRWAGQEAGALCVGKTDSRWCLTTTWNPNRRSHIVWALHRGEYPSDQIDHRDHDSLNDRIENLRVATQSQNMANTRRLKSNKTGYKGVHFKKDKNKYVARISDQGRTKFLGYFSTPQEAHAAYVKAARELFGEFACPG